jgi:sec-independent protein translocase protein TatC
LWYIGFLIIGSVIGYFLHSRILELLIKPLNQPIFYTSPAGGFDFTLKLSLFFGFLFALPVLVYQTIRFIEPALPKKFPHLLLTVLSASGLLLIIGMSFAYFVSLPAALYFLSKFTTEEVRSLISTNEYFSFITRYLLGFGLLFQLPLIMFAINTVQPIPIKTLMNQQRWVILGSFIIAGLLTPTPDLFNQFLMAGPLILLYQITVVMLWLVNRAKKASVYS